MSTPVGAEALLREASLQERLAEQQSACGNETRADTHRRYAQALLERALQEDGLTEVLFISAAELELRGEPAEAREYMRLALNSA